MPEKQIHLDPKSVLATFTGMSENSFGKTADSIKETLNSFALLGVEGVVEIDYSKHLLKRVLAWVGNTGVLENPLLAGMDISALQEAIEYAKTGKFVHHDPALANKLLECRTIFTKAQNDNSV
jgi:hypothetical protein